MKKILFGLLTALVLSTSVYSWDGVNTNTILKVDVALDGNNYGFRVYLSGAPKLCGNGNDWAYVNIDDSNYNTVVASLMSAHMAGRRVTLYTNRNSSGYCQIGYMNVL
jgi:hypothetical protein